MSRERTTAANWWDTREEFLQVCADANSQASREWDQEFASDQIAKARTYGLSTFISPKQVKHLCRIADVVEPPFKDAPEERSRPARGRSASREPYNDSSGREDGDPGYMDEDIPF